MAGKERSGEGSEDKLRMHVSEGRQSENWNEEWRGHGHTMPLSVVLSKQGQLAATHQCHPAYGQEHSPQPSSFGGIVWIIYCFFCMNTE